MNILKRSVVKNGDNMYRTSIRLISNFKIMQSKKSFSNNIIFLRNSLNSTGINNNLFNVKKNNFGASIYSS